MNSAHQKQGNHMPLSTKNSKSSRHLVASLIPAALFISMSPLVQAQTDPMIAKFSEPSMASFKKMFPKNFKVSSPSVKNHMLDLKYACPMRGKNVSPAISWSGVPKGTTRLHLAIIDGFCTWGCNSEGKANHWILDFPLSAAKNSKLIRNNGIAEGAASSKQMGQYTLVNAMGKRGYLGMCSPKGQPHAWVIQLTAYKTNGGKKTVTGKTQSVPFLFPKSEL